MKQQYLKAAVCSALLAFSTLASANTINFTNAADKIIDAELAPLFTSFEQQYGDTNWHNFSLYVLEQMPEYHLAWRNGFLLDEMPGLKRPVAFSELSNSNVGFTNTNLGFYTEKITEYTNGSPETGYNYRYSQLASFGQNGFTADFSAPMNSVNVDFALTDYVAVAGVYLSDFSILSSTPTILNAVYKDASGLVLGSSSTSHAFGTAINNSFSLDAFGLFSSVDFSWDTGAVTILYPGDKYDMGFGPYERTYSNLLTANNFAYTVTPVPEPSTYAMMLAGLGLMGWTAKRKKANQV